ncbi:MAG: TIGR02281 family clan AA aspartic protease [Sphingomonadales bacterium]|nr:TIGR02281 family clan AA aspartic protease [Sphingomonadales bacterium]MDE2569013.1 TIGR02281 family clan AA aspartic protease [Sphingomonadales bacterium]
MERVRSIVQTLASLVTHLPPLVQVALAALALTLLAGLFARRLPFLATLMRVGGNFALVVVLALGALSYLRPDPAFDEVLPSLGFASQSVVGGETRVPLSSDGHYWIDGKVNGTAQRFMVDTGATLTVLSRDAASAAGIRPDPLRLPVIMRTAGGPIEARLGTIHSLRAGSVEAKGLDAIVTGVSSGVNVLGMNFLGRLKAWRVEDGVLVLTPVSARNVAP